MRVKALILSVAVALSANSAFADTFGSGFTGYTQATVFSQPKSELPPIPLSYGGIAINPSLPNTLVIGGGVGAAGGAFYAVAVNRDPATQRITGIKTPVTLFASATDLAGGALFYPENSATPVLFYSIFSGSSGVDIGMIKAGSSTTNKVVNIVPETPGGVMFVPQGFSGAGQLKILTYSGKFYSVTIAPDANGTYNLSSPVLSALLPPQPSANVEGMVYLKAGSPGFTVDTLLVAETRAGIIAAYSVDANGNPIAATRRVFLSGPPFQAPEGLCFDPVTGDLLVTTAASSSSAIYRISGFAPPSTGGGVTFRALPDAFPRAGTVPLTVTFTTRGEYSGGSIIAYRWDFEGDGIFDTNEVGARDFTRTFTTPGTRNARLEIRNDKQQTTSATIEIVVSGTPPTATASVNPSNGAIPLAVTFTGTGTPGSNPISKYEWDFQGDGVFDFTSATTGSTTFNYATAGVFNAVFRVTDTAGLTATAAATTTAIRPGPPGSPTATITAPNTPQTRIAPATISFDGTGADPGGSIAKYEWDFNGDGTYEYSSTTTAATTFNYNSPGTFTAAFRVTDNEGQIGIDTVDITINIAATLSLSTDTLRPPGTVDVRTTIGGAAPVTVYLKNKLGQTVRTLVSNVSRQPGSYTDPWDGKDDAGNLLPEGAYYAVLRYLANGVPRQVDLTNTTGNSFFNPPWQLRTTGDATVCFACRFAPFEDRFLEGTFSLSQAAEVTLSIRSFFATYLEKALVFERKPFGRGSYTVLWEGTDNLGRMAHPAPPDSQFIFGMTAFTFPQNGIFLEVAPQLTNVTVSPNYFDPFTGDFQSSQKPKAQVQFTLSKAGNVTLQVIPVGSTTPLRTIAAANLSSGVNTLEWDGKADNGILVNKGEYRLALRATDAAGSQSLVRYLLMRVYY